MKDLIESFLGSFPSDLPSFIRKKINPLSRAKKIEFFRKVLQRHLPNEAVAIGIRELERLGYQNRTFYEGFLFHTDPEVKKQVRRILYSTRSREPARPEHLSRLLREGEPVDREFMVNNIFGHREPVDERILLTLLKYDDQILRKQVIRGIESEHVPDAGFLVEALRRGAVWYTRAGIVEILGKLRSPSLFDIIDLLLADPNVEVKLKLIRALGQFPRDRVEEYLQKLTHDRIMWVAREARKLLASLPEGDTG